MNGERLYEIMQDIDESLILEADPTVNRPKKAGLRTKLLPLAASLLLAVALWRTGVIPGLATTAPADSAMTTEAIAMESPADEESVREMMADESTPVEESGQDARGTEPAHGEPEKLPVASVWAPRDGAEAGIGSALGYRSSDDIYVYDFRPALQNTSTLPVYRYPGGMGDAFHLKADEAAMRNKAEDTARVFGLNPAAMEYEAKVLPVADKETDTGDKATYVAYSVLQNDEYIIFVDPSLDVSLTRRAGGEWSAEEEEWALSEAGLRADGEKLTALLKERYAWTDPVAVVTKSGVTYEGENRYRMFVYDSDPDPLRDFLNYNLKTACGAFSRAGEPERFHLYTKEAFVFAGDYPIRTEEEAKQALMVGEHLSGSEPAFPGEEYIVKTELVYDTNNTDLYMPYYRFYVQMPKETHIDSERGDEDTPSYLEDVKVYRTFVVPAVQEEYLEQHPRDPNSFE